MNFNASRNVGQTGGIRKAKRVSDVAAMGAPSPTPAFSPTPAYNPGFQPAGPPPPYHEGIQLDNSQDFGGPPPQAANYGYMGGFPQSPIPPAQLGSMLHQPIVQDMALQYGNQLAAQGREVVQREISKYVPVSRMRYYFAVDTRYVLRKLLLIMFPYTHKDMALQYGNQLAAQGREVVQREISKYVPVSRMRYYFAVDTRYVLRKLLLIMFPYTHKEWMVKYDQDLPVQPRYDINAPDLYIPSMGYVTYVLLAGFMLGLQHRFSPEQIGMQASSALAYIIFEMIMYLVTLYVTNTSTHLKTLDLLSFSGYKYIIMIASLMAGLMLGKTGYYCSLVYTSFALSYFLVKTLRLQLLAGPPAPDQSSYAYGASPYGAGSPYGGGGWQAGGAAAGGTKRRVYFLLFVAVTQPLLSWWLTYHLVPSAALPAPLPAPAR